MGLHSALSIMAALLSHLEQKIYHVRSSISALKLSFIQYTSTVGLYPFLKEFEEVSIWTTVFLTVLEIRIRRIRMFLGLHDPDPLVRGTGPALDSSLFS